MRTRSRLWIAALLVLANLAVYGQTLAFGFLDFDDHKYLFQHDNVRRGLSLDSLRWAFSTPYFSNWHPITWLSYMTDRELFGLDPTGFHAMNVALHSLATLLLFAWLADATHGYGRSGCVALLFAVHPLHVESVAWVSERKDLLSAVFGFAALWVYVRYSRCGGVLRYLGVTALFALGLMSKPMLVTLPFVMLLLDVWPLDRGAQRRQRGPHAPASTARLWLEKLPWLAMSAATCLATLWAQSAGGAMVPSERIAFVERLANAVVSYARYLGKTVWPDALMILYPHPYLAGGTPLTRLEVGGALAVLLLLSLGAWYARRLRYPAVGWLWFLGMLVPASGVVQVGGQAMADRYTYLPLVEIFIASVWGAGDLAQRARGLGRSALYCAAAGVLGFHAAAAWAQARVWRSDETLIVNALRYQPRNAVLHSALAREYFLEARLDDALHHYRVARRLAPAKPEVHFDLAEALRATGELEAAVSGYETALALDPDQPKAHRGLGRALIGLGRLEEAVAPLEIAARASPRDPRLRYDLARLLAVTGRPAEAIDHFEAASLHAPNWARPIDDIAWLLATHPDAALRDGRRAVALATTALEVSKGRRPLALATLAAALAEVGDMERAVPHAERALALAEERGANGWAADIRAALRDFRAGRPHRALPPRAPEVRARRTGGPPASARGAGHVSTPVEPGGPNSPSP